MDWMLIWTAVIAVGTLLGILVPIFLSIRKSDKTEMNEKIGTLKDSIASVSKTTAEKLDKEEFFRFGERIDKDIELLRSEQKTGHDRLYDSLKEFRLEVMNAIRDIRSK
jgi:hypothetical protein